MKNIMQYLILCLGLMSTCSTLAADKLDVLAAQSQTELEQGHYAQAGNLLDLMSQEANTSHDGYWQTWIQTAQGYLALQQRQFDLAAKQLDSVLATAQAQHWPELLVRGYLYRGQLRQRNGQWLEADQDFEKAVQFAKALPDLQASALMHRAVLARQQLSYPKMEGFLRATEQWVQQLPESGVKARLQLDLGYQWLQLRQIAPALASPERTYTNLSAALEQAKNLQLPRQMAQSLSYLGDLYALEGRDSEVEGLLQQALFYAQRSQSQDLLLQLEWQLGRYYAQHNQIDLAIAAYRHTVGHIQHLRPDIPVTYENGRSSFRDTLAPAYLELAALLFDKAKTLPKQPQQALLQEAQTTVEQIKKSELEDYFQSRCELPEHPLDASILPVGTAALYPVIFPTHVDVLLLTRDGLQHFSSPVQQTELLATINHFAAQLNAYADNDLASATTLYRYLVQPVADVLAAQQIKTLIYIPDGPLRLIPLGVLFDGQHTVLEKYAVIISPGLSISRTASASVQDGKVLLAGLSKPGSVINELPDSLVQGLLPSSISPLAEKNGQRGIRLRTLLTDGADYQSIQSSLALPSVITELAAISTQLPQATPMMNQAFTLKAFTEQVQEQPYQIVHIASHGFFDGTEQNSFIMTYDHILTMGRLDTLFNRDQTPGLLVLSACQTAEGNDRSPLGISGVLVKAKVKNVLGSLWPVSDEATTVLMGQFYQNLKQGLTKPEALRQAQLAVMRRKEFAAASFWSPFILVGEVE